MNLLCFREVADVSAALNSRVKVAKHQEVRMSLEAGDVQGARGRCGVLVGLAAGENDDR